MYVCMMVYIHIYIYIYVCIMVCIYIYIYIHILKVRQALRVHRGACRAAPDRDRRA